MRSRSILAAVTCVALASSQAVHASSVQVYVNTNGNPRTTPSQQKAYDAFEVFGDTRPAPLAQVTSTQSPLAFGTARPFKLETTALSKGSSRIRSTKASNSDQSNAPPATKGAVLRFLDTDFSGLEQLFPGTTTVRNLVLKFKVNLKDLVGKAPVDQKGSVTNELHVKVDAGKLGSGVVAVDGTFTLNNSNAANGAKSGTGFFLDTYVNSAVKKTRTNPFASFLKGTNNAFDFALTIPLNRSEAGIGDPFFAGNDIQPSFLVHIDASITSKVTAPGQNFQSSGFLSFELPQVSSSYTINGMAIDNFGIKVGQLPAPIPLPPAVWPGLAALTSLGVAYLSATRRRRV